MFVLGMGDAINEPGGLVPSPNVKLVMNDVSARHEIRDHGETVGAVRAGGSIDLFPAHHSEGRHRLGVDRFRRL